MCNRTLLLVGAIIEIVLLAVSGTVGVMALTHSGFMGNNGNYLPHRRSGVLYLQMPGPLRPHGNDGTNTDPGIHAGNLDRLIARTCTHKYMAFHRERSCVLGVMWPAITESIL